MKPQDSPYAACGRTRRPASSTGSALQVLLPLRTTPTATATRDDPIPVPWPSIHALTPGSSDARWATCWSTGSLRRRRATRYEACASGLRAAVAPTPATRHEVVARLHVECDMNGCDQVLRCASPTGYRSKAPAPGSTRRAPTARGGLGQLPEKNTEKYHRARVAGFMEATTSCSSDAAASPAGSEIGEHGVAARARSCPAPPPRCGLRPGEGTPPLKGEAGR